MAQLVHAGRLDAGTFTDGLELPVDGAVVIGPPLGGEKTRSHSSQRLPARRRSSTTRVRCALSASTVMAGSLIVRLPFFVLRSLSTHLPYSCWAWTRTCTRRCSRSTSCQRSP